MKRVLIGKNVTCFSAKFLSFSPPLVFRRRGIRDSSRKCFSRKLLCIFPFLAYVQIEGRDNCFWFEIHTEHGVWKTQKKFHSTLRAKRATFTFWVDKSLLKMLNLASFWKPWKRSNRVTRQVSLKRSKIGGKCQSWQIQMRHFGWFSNTVKV